MSLRNTLLLRTFGFFKIPLLFYLRPSVIQLSGERCVVRIPLRRRSKNHLGSMYFGALCAGADCAGGLIAMDQIRRRGNAVKLVFKRFEAEFLKRAHGDVDFTCESGAEIRALVERAIASGERENMPVPIKASVDGEPVARFTLTLSLKKRYE